MGVGRLQRWIKNHLRSTSYLTSSRGSLGSYRMFLFLYSTYHMMSQFVQEIHFFSDDRTYMQDSCWILRLCRNLQCMGASTTICSRVCPHPVGGELPWASPWKRPHVYWMNDEWAGSWRMITPLSYTERRERKEEDQAKCFHGDETMAWRHYEMFVTSALHLASVTGLTTLLASMHWRFPLSLRFSGNLQYKSCREAGVISKERISRKAENVSR